MSTNMIPTGGAVALKDSIDGEPISVQNPLQVDGVSVHASDLWAEESEMNGFSGVITDLFDNLHSVITDVTATNPKHILVHSQRTTVISSISLGAYTGNFSNLLVKVVTSGGTEIPIIDESADNTKYTSRSIELPVIGFNAMRIEFHTADAVSVSNLFMPKVMATVSRIQGQKTNEEFDFVSLTNGANMKVSLEEIESGISSNSNSQLNVTPFHADGTEGALITGVDYVAGKSGVDASTEVLEVIDYEHHEIHSGSHYNVCDYSAAALASGAVIEFLFTTPNTTEWTHLAFSIFSATGATIELYSGATGITGGTAITPINNNGNSISTSNVTILKDPSAITTDGTRVAGFLAGAGRDAGFAERSRENILTQGSTALVRITSTASQNRISWCAEWYEHSNKN